ncbi:unnamed protein product, partial [Calicophoron daubneyi]
MQPSTSNQKRGRHFLITYYDTGRGHNELIQEFDRRRYKYVFQLQRCKSTGRERYQMYIRTKTQCYPSVFHKLLPGAHIEFASNVEAAKEYCRKEESRIDGPWESDGADKKALSYKELYKDAKRGKPMSELMENYFPLFCRYYSNVKRAIQEINPTPPREFKTIIYWFLGATGTGKTRMAKELTDLRQSTYWKNSTEWWDGYWNHECVILDDYSTKEKYGVSITDLLRLFDRYPLKVNCKGYTVEFTSRFIIVTSQFAPSHYFADCTESYNALLRRIELLVEFPQPPEYLRWSLGYQVLLIRKKTYF